MKTITLLFIILAAVFTAHSQGSNNLELLSEVTIYFDSDESILTPDDKEKLSEIVSSTNNLKSYSFLVDAHTDEVGDVDYNLQLSEKRKASVVNYLVQQNIPQNLISSHYHGETQRIATATDEASRKLNRRVVLQLLGPPVEKASKEQLYLTGTIISEDSKKGIPAQIQLHSKDFESETITDSLGRFKILSPANANVILEVVAKDHLIASIALKITESHKDRKLKFPLSKIEAGKKFSLKNILFIGNKSIMLPSSYKSLEHLKRFMIANKNECIEIAGHVNVPWTPKIKKSNYDYRLSVARALEVHDELVNIGVNDKRLLARGYGNWQMIYPKALKEEQMKFNRRVEVIISSCDSTKALVKAVLPACLITRAAAI